MSKLTVVGIGPGDLKHMTQEAREAIEGAGVVVGYSTYLDLITPLLQGKEIVSTGMMREVERCGEALRLAVSGRDVALVSGGDAGIYGMAGLVLELAEAQADPPEIMVVPGVSAVQAAAAVLGAPLMHDFAVISLSDLLTPWQLIERRLKAAASADFVVALYNPRSKGRVRQLTRAREILLEERREDTPVGIVRHACRDGEEKTVTTLSAMLDHDIDMFSIIIIGNSATYADREGRMVTPRGYTAGTRYEARDAGGKAAGPRLKAPGSREGAWSETSSLEPGAQSPEAGKARAVMICGTGSDVGKSVITAGLCRILKRRGTRVAPFKSQNMALNSAVTKEGGEIGRAQAVQAEACGIDAHTDMNPILLKPSSDTGSQVILQGKVVGNMRVAEYHAYKPTAFAAARQSYQRLSERFDFVVIEGAGSIAEINLKHHDIANLAVAEMADCPAILVADIDRGGVFAQIVGTLELLTREERDRIKGIIINRFRGEPSLLSSGIQFVEERTGVPVLGVVPVFSTFRIPEEDSVALQKRRARFGSCSGGKIQVGVVRLPRISNYTDFDPLEAEEDVELHYVEGAQELENLDVLILPGSKSTIADLFFMMERDLFGAIQTFRGVIMGICGGYQMLGHRIFDPFQVESDIREAEGLGLLDVETSMLIGKETHQAEATLMVAGRLVAPDCTAALNGYEIHMGESVAGPHARPFATITSRSGVAVKVFDGAVSPDGRVFGTYLHGIFENDSFRISFLNQLRAEKGMTTSEALQPVQDPFDQLADHLERNIDMDRLLGICGVS